MDTPYILDSLFLFHKKGCLIETKILVDLKLNAR